MVSSKIFTSVLAHGFLKQPCNTELKGQSPGSCRPIVASAGTNPTTAAAMRRLPMFVRVSINAVFSGSSCLAKQEQAASRNGDTPLRQL